MPNQDGLRFLFDIQDKISAKLAKIEAKSISSAAKIDKAFTRVSKSQEANSAKAVASEQRRVVAVEKSHARAIKLLQRESDEFKRSMGRMATAATVAFAAVAGKAIQMAGGYDLAMRSVQAKTGATGALMDRLSEQSREMGRTTVHSATEAARGQAFLAQAGFDVHEVLEALPATLALATSGELDLASAADIASNVLSGFRLETDQAARVADVLAKAADSSNTNVAQLGAALAKAAPSAAAAGWSLEETAAAIGKLSDAGIQGEEAGTALKTMMAKLAIDGGPAEKLMAKMGITVKDTTGQMLPLNDILTALAPHANDVGLQFELLGTRGGNAGLVLGAVAQDAAVLTEELIDSAGWAQKNADIMSGGLWGALKEIQSIIESAYISFGERFTPAIKTLAALFKKLPAPIQEVVIVVGSLAGAMGGLMLMMPGVFGAITRLPGKLIALNAKIGLSTLSVKGLTLAIKSAWRALMGPVGWVIAIGAATVALGLFWRESQKAENKLPRLAKQIEDLTARIEAQGKATPRQATRLNQLTKSYDDVLASTRELPPQLTLASLGFEAVSNSAAKTEPPIVEVDEAVENLTDTIEWQSARLDHWGLQLDGIGKAVQPIPPFLSTLTGTVEDQSAALDHWGLDITNIGTQLDTLPPKIDETEQSAGKLDVTLAALAGQMGGAAGQSLNLVAAMIQTNDNLKEGEEGFSRVQIGAATAASGFHMLGDAIGGTGGAILSAIGDVASAFATGGLVAGIMAGVGALIKGIMSLGGPSEAEIAARETFAGFHKGAVDALGGTQAFADEVQVAINQGWDRTLAETRAGFIIWGQAAGLTYDEAFAKYAQYEEAVRTGNTRLMARLDAEFEGYRRSSEDANAAAAKAAEDAAAHTVAVWERAMSATMSAYFRAKDAGVKAYDDVFEAAIASGATQEEATARAEKAQLKAAAKILREERKKFIQLARFEAILAAIRSGNAEGAVAAGNKAAREVGQAWDLSIGQVTTADNLATGKKNVNAVSAANIAIDESRRASEAIVADIESIPTSRTVEIEYHGSQTGTHGGVDPSRVEIEYHGTRTGTGAQGRQHGGPVSAGRPYMVGERGPELFVPSRSGRIDPNVSSGGGVDAKAIGKAVSDALQGMKMEVDGRQLGRAVVRHQSLAVAELGGRR